MELKSHPTSARMLAATALAWGVALGAVYAAADLPQVPTQTSTAAGVTVKITARSTGADAPVWVFAVVLDTHTQELSDDLVNSVVLRTDDGRELKPQSWKGAAAGGHHREGTLEFAAPQPRPKSVELSLLRAGETEPRRFSWRF